MRITVLGATGSTGRQVVRHGLDDGHDITAVVRDPARLTVGPHPQLSVAEAAATDPDALTPHVRDADAVISALGARDRGPTTITSDGAAAVCTALRRSGSNARLVVVSASGAFTDGDPAPVRLLVKPLLGFVLRHPFADMRAMEKTIRAAGDIDWTIVRPPNLTDADGTGHVARRTDGNVRGAYSIPRADLAQFLVSAAASRDLSGVTVSVAAGS